MSLPLTNSVLTQHQEMINTAKRCNVRMGVDGERGGEQVREIPILHFCAATAILE